MQKRGQGGREEETPCSVGQGLTEQAGKKFIKLDNIRAAEKN